jgi:hypothetical membrane protein
VSSLNSTNHQLLIKWLTVGGMVAPVLFVAGILFASLFYDGYDHVSFKVSELGGTEAETPSTQNLNFMLLGLMVIGFAGALHWDISRLGVRSKGPFMLAIFGFSSALVNSVYPCDLGCDGTTAEALVHNLTGFGGFLVAMASMVVMARVFRRLPEWSGHYRFTQFCFAWALIALLANAAGPDSLGGLLQRIFIASLLTWIEGTAIFLYRRLRAEGVPA